MATATPTDAGDLIRTVLEAFSAQDFDTVAAAHADDVVLYENGTEYRGYDAVEEHMTAALHELGGPTFDLEELIVMDDTLVCSYTISAADTGTTAASSVLCLARIEDDKLQEIWVESTSPAPAKIDSQPNATEEANISTVRSLYEAAGSGSFDAEAFLAPLADDVQWIEPAGSPVGGVHRGHEGVLGILDTMVTDFESFEVVPDRYIADGASVAVPVTEHFVLDGGDQIEVRSLHLYDLEDGKIVRMENFEDTALLD